MKTKKTFVVALLKELGFGRSGSWGIPKLEEKINGIADFADEETELKDPKLAELLKALLNAANEGEEIKVVDDAPAPEPEAEETDEAEEDEAEEDEAEKESDDDAEEEEVEVDEEEFAEEKEDPKVKKQARKQKAEKKEKAKKEPKEKAGPSSKRTRSFVCGLAIKKLDPRFETGMTQEMVDLVEANVDKPNERETKFALRNAWHACRGFAHKDVDSQLQS